MRISEYLAVAAFHDEVKDANDNDYESDHCHPVEFHIILLCCPVSGFAQAILPVSHS